MPKYSCTSFTETPLPFYMETYVPLVYKQNKLSIKIDFGVLLFGHARLAGVKLRTVNLLSYIDSGDLIYSYKNIIM